MNKNTPSQTVSPARPKDERLSAPANSPSHERPIGEVIADAKAIVEEIKAAIPKPRARGNTLDAEGRTNKTLPFDELVAPAIVRIEEKAKARQSSFRQDERKWSEWEHAHKRRRILERANFPPRHLAATVQWTPASEWTRTYEILKAKLGLGFLCALIGSRGTGKTQLGVELGKASAEALRSVRYFSMFEVFLAVKESYRGEGLSEAQIIARFTAPSLLILDEAQERGDSEWEDRLITYLVDKRYQLEKDTLIVGNLAEEQFRDSLGVSVISRLEETGGIIQCTWKSFRQQ